MTGRAEPFPICPGGPCRWSPDGNRAWTLLHGDRSLARLEFRSSCGSLAQGMAGNLRWTFKRVGFFSPRLTIRVAGADTDLARMDFTGKGQAVLRWADGTYHFWRPVRPGGLEAGHWDRRFRRVLSAKAVRSRKGKLEGTAEWACHAVLPEILCVLVLMAWYRLVLEHDDREAVNTAASLTVLYS